MGRLKQWRDMASRYEKRIVNYRAMTVKAFDDYIRERNPRWRRFLCK